MKRKVFLTIGTLLAIIILWGIYKISTFNLFDAEFIELETIKASNKDYLLKVYYIPSNASSQSYIQVRKISSGVEEVLVNYPRFDKLEEFSLGIDSLSLVIKNSSLAVNNLDTVRLKLP